MPQSSLRLDYGKNGLPLDLSDLNAEVLRPRYPSPLANEAEAFKEAARNPIGSAPLKEKIGADDTVAVVIPDITRPLPSDRLLPWLFEELRHVPAENIVIISGTGTHRGNTEEEWRAMVGDEVYARYRCVDHSGADDSTLAYAGKSPFGYDVYFNSEYVNADRRILLGFIEPHFMAGFSGGYKAVFPGVASVETILHYHCADNIAHERSAWGIIEGNPTQAHVRAGGALLPVDFLINVTQDNHRRITGFFVGDPIEAHDRGCVFCRETAMVKCDRLYPIIVTTNSGYPLDQNLYQTVKGLSAASQVLEEGGTIICASRCNDGFPEHGNFRQFLVRHASPQSMLDEICSPGFRVMDQWQVQIFAKLLLKGTVSLYSELSDEETRSAHITPINDVRAAIDGELSRRGADTPIAILPEGPLTIPYLSVAKQ